MAKLVIPEGFTADEFNTYSRCLSKIAVGDIVHMYIVHDRFSCCKSETTMSFVVIAKSIRRRFVIGSKYHKATLWDIAKNYHNFEGTTKIASFKEYKYAWNVDCILDGRVAKIFKSDG